MNTTEITLQHIQNMMNDMNEASWKVYHDKEFAWRFESTKTMLEFHDTDMGKALLIVTKAWCDLYQLAQDLDSAQRTN